MTLLIRGIPWFFPNLVPYHFGDADDFMSASRALCLTTTYPDATELPFFRAPGLPLIISILGACQIESRHTARLILISLDMIALIGLFRIVHRMKGRNAHYALAGSLFSFSPMIVGQTFDLQSEPLFQCCLIWCVVILISNSPRRNWIAGMLLGWASLTRPIGLGLLPLLLLGVTIRSKPLRLKGMLAAALGFLVVVAPWTFDNWRRTGEFILINDAGGYNLWRGTHPINQEIYNARDPYQLARISAELEHQLTKQLSEETRHLSKAQRSELFSAKAASQIADDPIESAKLILRKLWTFVRPSPHLGVWPFRIWLAITVWETLLYGFAIKKLYTLRSNTTLNFGVVCYLTLTCLFSMPFQVVSRFRAPLWEWVLIVLIALPSSRTQDNSKKSTDITLS
jgi:hypothetical protein